jgi:hypothetical protein
VSEKKPQQGIQKYVDGLNNQFHCIKAICFYKSLAMQAGRHLIQIREYSMLGSSLKRTTYFYLYSFLRIGTSGGLLWKRQWTFGLHKVLGSSWVAVHLSASQQGLSSMKLVCILIYQLIFDSVRIEKTSLSTQTCWTVYQLLVHRTWNHHTSPMITRRYVSPSCAYFSHHCWI